MNINLVKLPLIHIEHPSKEQCDQEFQKIESKLFGVKKQSKHDIDDDEGVLITNNKIKDEGAPRIQFPPNLFNFDHHYDKDLVPLKDWQKQVNNLNSMLEYEKEKALQKEKENLEMKQQQETQIVQLSTQIQMQKNDLDNLNSQIQNEKQMKEEINKQLQRSIFDMDKAQKRFQQEKSLLQDQLQESSQKEKKKEAEIQILNEKMNQIQQELNRVKISLVNKDSQNQSLEEMLKREKDRREGENGELRNLFRQEQEKALQAAREAQKFQTEIIFYQKETAKAKIDLENKIKQVEELQKQIIEQKAGKNQIQEQQLFKFENLSKEIEHKYKDQISSLMIKINNKESDMYKMEQLLLRINHQIDQTKMEKEQIQNELEMVKIEKIRIEEAAKYQMEQYEQTKEKLFKFQEESEKQIVETRMNNWKFEATQKLLVDQISRMSEEIERLQKIKDISESIARLPSECLTDLKSQQDISLAKQKGLKQALQEIKGKDYDNLIKDIDSMEEKQKRAYVRLYEKVGEEIGLNFLDKLNYVDQKSRHAQSQYEQVIQSSQGKFSSSQNELNRLQKEKIRIAEMQKQKNREFLKSEIDVSKIGSVNLDGSSQKFGFQRTSIGDLFKKYNI